MPLTRFQEAAVNRIVEALEKKSGRGRFLLADEVGLGKTLVAKGVIDELQRRQKNKALTVVYICSNTQIVEQNKGKLVEPFEFSTERLTLLPIYSQNIAEQRRHNLPLLFSFTPGTSLSLGRGSGNKRERQLLLYLLAQGSVISYNTHKWREFFKGGCSRQDWEEDFSRMGLNLHFNRWTQGKPLESKYLRAFKKHLRNARVQFPNENHEVRRLDQLDRWVDEPDPRKKNLIIGSLRECLAMACLEFIDPDLIIMDEFQRFTDTMDNCSKEGTLESALIGKDRAKILILSATPYKPFNTRNENGSHYSEFYKTLSFLFREDAKEGPTISQIGQWLEDFRKHLKAGDAGESTKALKDKIETHLKEVMCRTERYWYIEESNKGVLEIPANGEATKRLVPRTSELIEYARLQQFLLEQQMGSVAIDYWKSCPSILTFMDSSYKFIQKIQGRRQIPQSLMLRDPKLANNHLSNLKFRLLLSKVLDNEVEAPQQHTGKKELWRHLWIPPIYQYYSDPSDLVATGRPHKFLIFSHWRFVPRAIAAIVSKQIEMRCPQYDPNRSGTLKFAGDKVSLFPFDICFPSLRLAREIQPLTLAFDLGKLSRSKEFIASARLQLLEMMKESKITLGSQAPSHWKVIARLEATGPDADLARRLIIKSQVTDDENEYYQHHAETYLRYLDDTSNLTVSAGQVEKILQIALFSPAHAILRSAMSVLADPCSPEAIEQIYHHSIQLGVNELRNYFNRPLVQTVIRQTADGKHYNDRVLNYCRRGHFQEMMDEFCYLMAEVLQKKNHGDKDETAFADFFDHLAGVFQTYRGATSMNMADESGRLLERKTSQSAHFALAFGETESEENPGQQTSQQRTTARTAHRKMRLRGTTVRDAFNSPFWPFVLATTSRGQEGLDFHLYCRDVVHWNLPSNPVDLEQREGRINRYDGLCIRQSIEKDYDLFKLQRNGHQPGDNHALPNLWKLVFDTIQDDQDRQFSPHHFKHGLFPHWIYVPRNGTQKNVLVRRHLLFYYGSRDLIRYKRLKHDLGYYRIAFGQPRQQDMIEEILNTLKSKGTAADVNLEHLMINLSPLNASDIWDDCKKGAKRILRIPDQTTILSERVKALCDQKPHCLGEIAKEIQDLLQVSSIESEDPFDRKRREEAVAALLYLLNPYDTIYDRFPGFGFVDDVERIRKVHQQLGLQLS